MSWLSSFFSWVKNLVTGSTTTSEQIVAIQVAAVKLCGFLPLAESITAIIAQGNPAVVTAAAVATRICAIVKTVPPLPTEKVLMGLKEEPVVIHTWQANGVTIQGSFIK